MDPRAFILLLASLHSAPDGGATSALASALMNQARLVPAYVTIQGPVHPGARRVHVIRQGQVIVVDLKKIWRHPELDFKLQPGDIVDFPEAFF